MFCPRTQFHIVRFEKFLQQQGLVFEAIVLSTMNAILFSTLNICPIMLLKIHICVVPFEGPLHLWLKSHLCFTLDHMGDQLWFRIQLQIHIWVVLFDLTLGSTPSLASVPPMSDLRPCVGSTLDPDPAADPYLCCPVRVNSFSGSSHIYVSPSDHGCKGINTVSGSSSRSIFLQTIILRTNNSMLSSKLNVLSHNSIPSGHN